MSSHNPWIETWTRIAFGQSELKIDFPIIEMDKKTNCYKSKTPQKGIHLNFPSLPYCHAIFSMHRPFFQMTIEHRLHSRLPAVAAIRQFNCIFSMRFPENYPPRIEVPSTLGYVISSICNRISFFIWYSRVDWAFIASTVTTHRMCFFLPCSLPENKMENHKKSREWYGTEM